MNKMPRFVRTCSVGPGSDHLWKSLTEAANAALEAGEMVRAAALYDQAYEEALKRFRNDRGAASMTDAPPMLVTSAANFADFLALVEEPKEAASKALDALECLSLAMLDPDEPTAFRTACFHHLMPALLDVADRVKDAGITPGKFKQVALGTRAAAFTFLSENSVNH